MEESSKFSYMLVETYQYTSHFTPDIAALLFPFLRCMTHSYVVLLSRRDGTGSSYCHRRERRPYTTPPSDK